MLVLDLDMETTKITLADLTKGEQEFFRHLLAHSGNGIKDIKEALYCLEDTYTCFKALDLIGDEYSSSQVGGFMSSLESRGLIQFDEETHNPLWWVTITGVRLAVDMFTADMPVLPDGVTHVSFQDKLYPTRLIFGKTVATHALRDVLMTDDGSDWISELAEEIECQISYYVDDEVFAQSPEAVKAHILEQIDEDAGFEVEPESEPPSANQITPDQLLDCLGECDVMVSAEYISDLRGTLRSRGYAGPGMSMPTTALEAVDKAAEVLVAEGKALWLMGGWLTLNSVVIRCQDCGATVPTQDYLNSSSASEVAVGDDCGLCRCGGAMLAETKVEPGANPEELQPFTVELTYTATYGDSMVVYARNAEEALDKAQRGAPFPCADSLISNCECDFEVEGEVA